MKRCPQCNRVETDEALKFCRVDGATLISDSSSLGGEAGTAQLGSPTDASEVHTSVLPHTSTIRDIHRSAGPTTGLPVQVPGPTGKLIKRRNRWVLIAVAVLVVVLLAGIGLIYALSQYIFAPKPAASDQSKKQTRP